jgi:uncharacterized membrane protein
MKYEKELKKMVLAALLVAMTFVSFQLTVQVPLGVNTVYLYLGHGFIFLAGMLLGPVYGGAVGALGLSLGDLFAGKVVSAIPTILASFLIGWLAGILSTKVFHLNPSEKVSAYLKKAVMISVIVSVINVVTEPLIRLAFKLAFGEVAFVGAAMWAYTLSKIITMVACNLVSILLVVFLAPVVQRAAKEFFKKNSKAS